MIEYKSFVTPIKVDDSLVKKEFDEKVTGLFITIHMFNLQSYKQIHMFILCIILYFAKQIHL